MRKIIEQNATELLRKKNVVTVGLGTKYKGGKDTGIPAIVAGVVKKEPLYMLSEDDVIPSKIKEMDTDVIEVGKIRLLAGDTINRTGKFRPAPGGVSVGEKTITAGTLGCLVKKKGELYILSNNHVLAAGNTAPPGSEILQPGYADGGRVGTCTLATLTDCVKIVTDSASECLFTKYVIKCFNALAKLFHRKSRLTSIVRSENLVDCALARPVRDKDVLGTILEDGGKQVKIVGEMEPVLNMSVKKTGRTTGTTHSRIIQTDVVANIFMDGTKTATFVDQFAIINPFSEPGDSGSAVLTEHDRIVGLLFAGSSTITLANRWKNVKFALDLDGVA